MFERINHVLQGFAARYEANPSTRSRTLLFSGTLLIIEGTLGVVRNGITKKSSGLIGAISGLCAGAVFMWAGNFLNPSASDAIQTEGVITSFEEVYESGRLMYAPIYSYKVGEKEFQYISSTHYGSMPVVGQTVTLEYSKQQPQYAYRTDGLDWLMNNGLRYLGLALVISSLLAFAFNAALISIGIYLIILSRRESQGENPVSLARNIRNAWKEITRH